MEHIAAPRPGRRRTLERFFLVAGVLLVVALSVAIGFRDSAARAVIAQLGRSFGYDVRMHTLHVDAGGASALDIRIRNAADEPVFEARRIDVAYVLRDLLPGGQHRFGLKSIDVASPHVTLIHHADGSYNIELPKTSTRPLRPNTTPLDLRLRVRDGSVDIVDRFVAAPGERRQRIAGFHADAVLSPNQRSYYHVGATLEERGARYPIAGNARFDDARGFEIQHWTAGRLPVAAFTNFVLPNRTVVVDAGDVRNLDVKLGALGTPGGNLNVHLGITGELTGARIAIAALAKPVRDAHGTFVVNDDGLSIPTLDATLNGVPLHVRGGLYHFASPQVAFALTGTGDLARLREVSKDVSKLPLAGLVTVQGLAEGPVANPVVFARLRSREVDYGAFRFDGPRGFVALSGQELVVFSSRVGYGRIALAARGDLQLQQHTQTSAYATVSAPAAGLPYAGSLVPQMVFGGTAVVNGIDGKLATRGLVTGTGGGDRLDAPFSIAANGIGTIGPLALQRHDGASVYARVVLDRPANSAAAIIETRALSLHPARFVALPGMAVPPVPPSVNGKLDADLVGYTRGSTLVALGGSLHASGAWGDVRADADGSATGVAARGRVSSSFERLAAFTGNVGARGGIDAPFAVASDGRNTIVQVADARFTNASIRGIALQAASATLGVRAGVIDIYAARLRVANRDITAHGRFGNGGRVAVTAGDLDPGAFRAIGFPLSGGRITALALLGGTFAKPTGNVRAALTGARYANNEVGGDVNLAYDGATLHIRRATLGYAGTYASASGTVAGLTLGHIAPRYAIVANVADADVATLARTIKNPLRYPEGTLDANVRVAGTGAAPTINGDLRLPEGSLNGLSFRDAHVALAGNVAAVAARGGRMTVGGTTLQFDGNVSRARQSVKLRADRVDLADFNDYFDEADVLAGTGRLAATLDASPSNVDASADIAFNGARYRRFVLGATGITVHTAASSIRANVNVDGVNGHLALAGTLQVPRVDPVRDILHRSYVDMTAHIAGINLGNVLPAAGSSLPLLGSVDGSATVRGRYPALSLVTNAALIDGVVGRVPITRFTIAATAANGRGRITDATLVTSALNATASGTFGVRTTDAFDINARVVSPDINALALSITGKAPGVKGALDTRLHVTGTAAHPQLASTIDLQTITYDRMTIPSIHTAITATRQAIDVRSGTIALPHDGTIAFDGHAPLGGGASTPIAFDFTPHNVDLNPYSALLPDGSALQGVLDGNVAVRGTLATPRLGGYLNYDRGSYRSNTLKLPLTALTLHLNFNGSRVQVAKLHAHAAPGNIDGDGTIVLGDLRDPMRGLTADVTLKAVNALISAPKYYVGFLDGTVAATKAAASPLLIGGDVTASSARIPYTALLPSSAAGATQSAAPPNVNLHVALAVGRDVRVQSGPVDIGTTGSATLGGTLAKPTLDGGFLATDGTVSFYRTFTLQSGSTVAFDPSNGIIPSIDATAATHIPDPSTDVLLHVTGLATQLNLAFDSQPAYSREQIVGLLVNAQALGAVSGVAQTSNAGGGTSPIAGITQGFIDQQFSRTFLSPLGNKLGGALGLSNLDLNYDTNGAVSAIARRTIGHNVSFVYGQSFGGITPRASLGLNIGNRIAGAQLTYYNAEGSPPAFGGALTPYLQSSALTDQRTNYTLQAIEPPNGASGFVFSFQRRFW